MVMSGSHGPLVEPSPMGVASRMDSLLLSLFQMRPNLLIQWPNLSAEFNPTQTPSSWADGVEERGKLPAKCFDKAKTRLFLGRETWHSSTSPVTVI